MTSPADEHDEHDEHDELGSGSFPLAIIPLAFLVLFGIVAGLLLADRVDSTTPPGAPVTTVTTITSVGVPTVGPGMIEISR